MFLEYQCAAMTPVEIRGVKVVTRDAPKIYKNCQRRSAVRTKKFQDKFPLNTRRYYSFQFSVQNNFSCIANGCITVGHSPLFLALLRLEFATNDHSDVDTFFSPTSTVQQKKIFDHPRAPGVHSISNSVDIQVLRVFPHFDFCVTEYLRTPIFIVCKDNKYFFRNRPVRIQKKSINGHHFCHPPLSALLSLVSPLPLNAVDIIDVNRNEIFFFFFQPIPRPALGWIIVALPTTRHVATYHAKVSS